VEPERKPPWTIFLPYGIYFKKNPRKPWFFTGRLLDSAKDSYYVPELLFSISRPEKP